MNQPYDSTQQDTSFRGNHWMKTLHCDEKLYENAPLFVMIMKQYKSTWDEPLGQVTIATHYIVSNLPDNPPLQSAPYHAGAQWELKPKAVGKR